MITITFSFTNRIIIIIVIYIDTSKILIPYFAFESLLPHSQLRNLNLDFNLFTLYPLRLLSSLKINIYKTMNVVLNSYCIFLNRHLGSAALCMMSSRTRQQHSVISKIMVSFYWQWRIGSAEGIPLPGLPGHRTTIFKAFKQQLDTHLIPTSVNISFKQCWSNKLRNPFSIEMPQGRRKNKLRIAFTALGTKAC